MKEQTPSRNTYGTREEWLSAAVLSLRPYFDKVAVPLPDRIRVSIGFTSGGKRANHLGECWQHIASADGHYEIFIRPDEAEPVPVLGTLVHELVHTAVPPEAKHGKVYKAAAIKVGLEGKMTTAGPGPVLSERLHALAADLGPFPHASLNSRWVPVDRPKKQRTRMLKAECEGEGDACGYTVRVTAKWVKELGPPHCPKHGAMTVDLPSDDGADSDED